MPNLYHVSCLRYAGTPPQPAEFGWTLYREVGTNIYTRRWPAGIHLPVTGEMVAAVLEHEPDMAPDELGVGGEG